MCYWQKPLLDRSSVLTSKLHNHSSLPVAGRCPEGRTGAVGCPPDSSPLGDRCSLQVQGQTALGDSNNPQNNYQSLQSGLEIRSRNLNDNNDIDNNDIDNNDIDNNDIDNNDIDNNDVDNNFIDNNDTDNNDIDNNDTDIDNNDIDTIF